MAIKKTPEPPKAAAKKAPAPKTKVEAPKTAVTAPVKTATGLTVFDPSILEQDARHEQGMFGKDDLATPFLRCLQGLSPQIDKNNPKYVEGAEQGFFLDTSDGELWDGEEGILVIPVHYTPSFIEWKIREKGGGFVKDHGPVDPGLRTVRDDRGRDMIPNTEHQLVKSGLYYVFVVNPDDLTYKALAFPLQGTQLKKSRVWNTQIKSLKISGPNGGTFTPASYYHVWKIRSVYESNDKGNWYGVAIELFKPLIALDPDRQLELFQIYNEARDFKVLIESGTAKAKMETLHDEEIVQAEPADGTEEAY